MKFLRTFENLKQIILDTGCVVDNQFLNDYVNLIYNNLSTENISRVTQRHHFIPASAYEDIKENSPRSLANRDVQNFKVNLIFYDHLRAHLLLVQCGKTLSFIAANAAAVSLMYNNLKRAQKDGIVQSLNTDQEVALAYKYIKDKQAEEVLKSGKKPFDLVALNRNRLTGKVAIHNKVSYSYVTPEEATQLILNEGWKPGLKSCGQYCTVNKDGNSGIIRTAELLTYLQNGWSYQSGGVAAGAKRLHIYDVEFKEEQLKSEQVTSRQKKAVRCCETGEVFPTIKALAKAFNLEAYYGTLADTLRASGKRGKPKQQKLFGKTFEYCWVEV